MEKWRTSWIKIVSRFWIPAVAVLAGLVAWMVFRAAPMWLEERISRALREHNVVVADLPIEHIGSSQLEFGSGSILYSGHSLGWDAIRVEYKLEQLLRKQVGRIDVQTPQLGLSFKWPQPDSPLADGLGIQEGGPAAGAPEVGMVAVDSDRDASEGAAQQSAVANPATDSSRRREGDASGVFPQDTWESLQTLPAEHISLREGVVNLRLQTMAGFNADFEGELARQPFGVAGELFVESAEGSANLSLRAPSKQPVITVQGSMAMPVNALRSVGNFLMDQMEAGDHYPRIGSSGALTLDLFVEHTELEGMKGSAEAYLDEISLAVPNRDLEVILDELRSAGFYRDSAFFVEGGGEILIPPVDDLNVDPFRFRFSLKESEQLNLETEVFNWSHGGLAGRCALRGGANLAGTSDNPGPRLEASFARLTHGRISADPFSILFSKEIDRLAIQASPLGLNQSGTLWIEEISGEANSDLSKVQGGFTFYGLVGQALGSAEFTYSRQGNSIEYEMQLSQLEGKSALTTSVVDDDGDHSMQASGEVQLSWINTLLNWFGYRSFSFGGQAPRVSADLTLKDSLLSGFFDTVLSGVNVSFDNGTQVEGVAGEIGGAVMILPRTLGKQVTRITRISSGPILMEDIRVEWELKSLRELVVYNFSGRIGQGIVELEPFIINPIRPVLKTAIVIRKFDADLLRQWLKEERFSIDALIGGRIPVGWENGQLILGSGKFNLDRQIDAGWLRFEDEQFLREKFAAVGGVPKDLKDRLLNALWKNGIQMKGMEIYLGATENREKLSFKISVNGETASELIEFPIGGFVLNNLISLEDLATLLNMVAPVRFDPDLGR